MSRVSPGPEWTIDTTKASVARVYDAALGGKDNYAVDREMVQKLLVQSPDAFETPKMVKEFGRRVTRYAAERGIRQFLDLGSGIPTTPPSIHDTARAVDPDVRVVYVDSDPVVVAHSRALRDIGPGFASILADIRQPETITGHPDVAERIDFDQPLAVLLISVLQNILDDTEAREVVRTFAARVAPGSYLGLAHISARSTLGAMEGVHRSAAQAGYPATLFRDDDSVRSLFDGFELLEPGLIDIKDWRPDDPDIEPVSIKLVGGLGLKTG